MRPGTAVTVTWGRYSGRKGVISEPADADGVVTVRRGAGLMLAPRMRKEQADAHERMSSLPKRQHVRVIRDLRAEAQARGVEASRLVPTVRGVGIRMRGSRK